MEAESLRPVDLVEPLEAAETWSEVLSKKKDPKQKAAAVGRFIKSFRPPSRDRQRAGSTYGRLEVLEILERHAPPAWYPRKDCHICHRASVYAGSRGGRCIGRSATGTAIPKPVTGAGPWQCCRCCRCWKVPTRGVQAGQAPASGTTPEPVSDNLTCPHCGDRTQSITAARLHLRYCSALRQELVTPTPQNPNIGHAQIVKMTPRERYTEAGRLMSSFADAERVLGGGNKAVIVTTQRKSCRT